MSENYDLAVIGAGPGGYVAAIRASQLGQKVCVIEKDKPGGVCLNLGCIPTKTLIHQAELYSSLPELQALGINFDTGGFDYKKAFAKSRKAADTVARGVNYLLKKNNIDYISGSAIINSDKSVSIDSGITVNAGKILIASGSRPRELKGFEFDGKSVLSSDDILMQEKLPDSIIILGGGAIGSEFAYIFSSLGVKVYIVEMLDRILPSADADCSSVLTVSFKKQKIEIFTKAKALKCINRNSRIFLDIEKDGDVMTLEAEQLLVVTGRVPNTEKLGLSDIGLATDKGFIPVKNYYQTSIEGIYAVGDVINSPQLAHVASKEGEIAAEHIAGKKPSPFIDQSLVPYAVYTNPGISGFGLTEEAASSEGADFKTFSFPFRGTGKAAAIGKKDGFVKIICNKTTSKIIGCHIAGEQAPELIHELLLAAGSGLMPHDIAGMIHAHPSLSEAVMEAMRGIEGRAVHI